MTPYVLFCVKDRSLFVINLASLSKYDTEKNVLRKTDIARLIAQKIKSLTKKNVTSPIMKKKK